MIWVYMRDAALYSRSARDVIEPRLMAVFVRQEAEVANTYSRAPSQTWSGWSAGRLEQNSKNQPPAFLNFIHREEGTSVSGGRNSP